MDIFKGRNLIEFSDRFKTDLDCKEYLAHIKWKDGFECTRFEHLRSELKVKPRTYREVARKKYLAESKKRQANKKTLRSAIRYHLNCLDRNVRSINAMLDLLGENPMPRRMLRDFWVVQAVNAQQREMYSNKTNRCDDRIMSISRPYVRPIVRGKAGRKVEFGTKMGLAWKLSGTSHSWIGAILFVTNLVKFAQLNDFQF